MTENADNVDDLFNALMSTVYGTDWKRNRTARPRLPVTLEEKAAYTDYIKQCYDGPEFERLVAHRKYGDIDDIEPSDLEAFKQKTYGARDLYAKQNDSIKYRLLIMFIGYDRLRRREQFGSL